MKEPAYLMLRTAGAPTSFPARFSCGEIAGFNKSYFSLLRKVNQQARELQSSLLAFYKVVPDKEAFNFILNISRAVQHHKQCRRKDFRKGKAVLPEAIVDAIFAYENALQQLEKLRGKFCLAYPLLKLESIDSFRQLLNNDDFKSGLVLSSSILFTQLEKLSAKDIADFKKKDFNIVNGLLKYYSRMCTKTSPFSRFGIFSLARPAAIQGFCQMDSSETTRKLVCFSNINHQVFHWFQRLVLHHPELFKNLYLQLNNSLTDSGNAFLFLHQNKKTTSFQQLGKNSFLELLVTILRSSDAMTVRECIAVLQGKIDADETTLFAYLKQLLDAGFIQTSFGIAPLDVNWPQKLMALLQLPATENLPVTKMFLASLNQLIVAKNDFNNANPTAKNGMIQTTYLQLQSLGQYLGKQENYPEHVAEFSLPRTALFYEDCTTGFTIKINATELQATRSALATLCRTLPCFPVGNVDQGQIKSFYLSHYPKGKTVPLTEFYFAYSKLLQKENKAIEQGQYFEKWKAAARAYFTNKLSGKETEVHLDLQALQTINHEAGRNSHPENAGQSCSFMLQFFTKNNKRQAIINNVFTGHGKMFHRFLPMFPGEVTQAFRDTFRQQFPDALSASLTAKTFFNANIHPNLPGAEILLPDVCAASEDARTISLNNLVVATDETSGQLVLKTKATGQQCLPFDSGFQSPADRSELYRFLLAFSPSTLPGIFLINKAINDVFKQKQQAQVVALPKISFGDKLVLQRKMTCFPAQELPQKTNGESEAAYFLRLQEWRVTYDIPKEVFIKFQKPEAGNDVQEQAAYKPQYIHFESLLFVRLFSKMVSGKSGVLLFSAVLPGWEDAVEIGGEGYAGEVLVEVGW